VMLIVALMRVMANKARRGQVRERPWLVRLCLRSSSGRRRVARSRPRLRSNIELPAASLGMRL
jgi:hypothetical protein